MSNHDQANMTTQDLIELNTLYALGMLDQDEQSAFEHSLQSASPHVRERVFAEARRLADLGDLLPDEEPTPELRALVLSAVRAAMHEHASRSHPHHATVAPAAAIAGRITPAPVRTSQPAVPRGARVHPVWRAAAIGLAAATVALTVVSAQNRDIYKQLDNQFLITEAYDTMGAEFVESMLMDTNSKRIALTATDAASATRADIRPVAAVWHNADWNTSRLFIKNLKASPDAEPYRLVVLDADGNIVREIKEFIPTGELEAINITINPTTDAHLAIYQGPQGDQPLLTSSI